MYWEVWAVQLGIQNLNLYTSSQRWSVAQIVPWLCLCESCFFLPTSLSSVLEIRWIVSLPSGLYCLLRNLLSPK